MAEKDRRNWEKMDRLADEARRVARRIEENAPLPGSVIYLPPGIDPKHVHLESKMRFTTEYEAAEELVRLGQMLPPIPPPFADRSWRHHVWDMLKDAWAFINTTWVWYPFRRKP